MNNLTKSELKELQTKIHLSFWLFKDDLYGMKILGEAYVNVTKQINDIL